jgi:hypothetical protein
VCAEGIWIAEEVGEGDGGKRVVVGVGLCIKFYHCCGWGGREGDPRIGGGW